MHIRPLRLTSPARLHFGMLSFGNADVPQFGGAGVMIDEPGVSLDIRESDTFQVLGTHTERVVGFARQWSKHEGMAEPPACTIDVWSAPPQHVGLGTGTQLALSVAAGLTLSLGRPFPASDELARSVGRGRRSAIGTYGFLQGGLIAEMGKRDPDLTLGEFASRIELPEQWCFLVALPRSDETGISGAEESEAFRRLSPVPAETSAELRRELRQVMLPAAANGDFVEFSRSLYRFGHGAGACFASIQGGPYACEFTEHLVHRIRSLGYEGTGQSSWGPAVFAVTRNRDEALSLIEKLEPEYAQAVHLSVAKPQNSGFSFTWR